MKEATDSSLLPCRTNPMMTIRAVSNSTATIAGCSFADATSPPPEGQPALESVASKQSEGRCCLSFSGVVQSSQVMHALATSKLSGPDRTSPQKMRMRPLRESTHDLRASNELPVQCSHFRQRYCSILTDSSIVNIFAIKSNPRGFFYSQCWLSFCAWSQSIAV